MFQEIATSSLWSEVWPKFVAALLAGFLLFLIRLVYVEWKSRTRLETKLKWRSVDSGFQMTDEYIGSRERQNHPVLQVRHRGRRDKARISEVRPRVFSGFWPLGENLNPLKFEVIKGKQPFSQGEELLLQLAADDLFDQLRPVGGEEAVKVRFILSDAVTDKQFKTPEFEICPATLENYDPLS
jgi:hypothetical protein